jgi:hypothetical protein
MKKLWPYLLGLTVLLVGAIVSSRMLPKNAAGASARKPAFSATQLQPVRVAKPPEALYFLVAQALVEKLQTGDLLLTVREYRELIRRTSLHLREDLGLELPAGFILPPSVSKSWLEHPDFSDPDYYTFLQQVQAGNRDYLQKIVGRLLDEYAPQTMQLMVERLAAIQAFRKPGDAESLSFVKALYGESFVNDYATAHRPKEDQAKPSGRKRNQPESSQAVMRPAKEVAAAQAQVSSLWRTEFGPEELSAVREYILSQNLRDKLRDDLLYSDLSAAERSLMEKSVIGCRLVFLHDLTCRVVSTRQ